LQLAVFTLVVVLTVSFTSAQLAPHSGKDFMEFSDGSSVPITWSLTNLIRRVQALWSGDADTSEQGNKSVEICESVQCYDAVKAISSQEMKTPELRHILDEREEFQPLSLRLKSKPMNIPEDEDDEL